MNDYDRLKEQYDKVFDDREQLRADYEQADKAYRTQALLASKYEAEVAGLQDALFEKMNEIERLRQMHEQVSDLAVERYREVERLREDIITFSKLLDESRAALNESLTEVERLTALAEAEVEARDSADRQMVSLKTEVEQLRFEYAEPEKHVQALRELYADAKDKVERLQARVADFESGRVYEELQDKINKRRAAMADIEQDVKALTDRIAWWDAVLIGEEV